MQSQSLPFSLFVCNLFLLEKRQTQPLFSLLPSIQKVFFSTRNLWHSLLALPTRLHRREKGSFKSYISIGGGISGRRFGARNGNGWSTKRHLENASGKRDPIHFKFLDLLSCSRLSQGGVSAASVMDLLVVVLSSSLFLSLDSFSQVHQAPHPVGIVGGASRLLKRAYGVRET
jgi:hypothetical protein